MLTATPEKTAKAYPAVIASQPAFSAFERTSNTPPTTPFPSRMSTIVPTNSPKTAGSMCIDVSIAPGILFSQFTVRDHLLALPLGIFSQLARHQAGGGWPGCDAGARIEEQRACATRQHVFEAARHFVADGPDDFDSAKWKCGMKQLAEFGVSGGKRAERRQIGAIDSLPVIRIEGRFCQRFVTGGRRTMQRQVRRLGWHARQTG